jgi:hypothetical protein
MPAHDPAAELARLGAQRAAATQRISDIEAEARAATTALGDAQRALVEAERRDAPQAQRAKLEQALAKAKARANEPWAERRAGAAAAARDRHAEQSAFAKEHLDALIATLEADGAVAAAGLDSAAEGVLAAYHAREACSSNIAALLVLANGQAPRDAVTRTRGEALAREASTFLTNGGETPPRLRDVPAATVTLA